MEHCITTDVRDLDNLYLATIGGVDYFEVRQIVKHSGGVRSVVGVSSDWPLIHRDARLAELTALLVASEARSVEADCHVSELISRESGYREHIAALEAALAETQLVQITPPEAETAEQPTEREGIICLVCARSFKNKRAYDTHKRLAHGTTLAEMAAPAWACADCGATSDPAVADATRCKACVRKGLPIVSVPLAALGDAPWRCEACHSDTHARSLSDPAHCIRCVVELADAHTNGHQVAA